MSFKLKLAVAATLLCGLFSQGFAAPLTPVTATINHDRADTSLVQVEYYYFQKPITITRYRQGRDRYAVVGRYGKYRGYYSRKHGTNDNWERSGVYLGKPDRIRPVEVVPTYRYDCAPRYQCNCCR